MPIPDRHVVDEGEPVERSVSRIYRLHAWGFAGSHLAVAVLAVIVMVRLDVWLGVAVFVANGGPAIAAVGIYWYARRMRAHSREAHTRHAQGAKAPGEPVRRVLPTVQVDNEGHEQHGRHAR